MFSNRFLPPAVPLIETESGLQAPDLWDDAGQGQFPPLFIPKSIHPRMLPRNAAGFKALSVLYRGDWKCESGKCDAGKNARVKMQQ